MTVEEKAKAYDEALDRAIELYEKDSVFDSEKTLIRCIFPELAESEDERIKKAISQCVEDMRGQFEKLYGVHHKDAIAWLEKQGSQQPTIIWHSVSEEPEEMKELFCEWESNDATWHDVAFYDEESKTFRHAKMPINVTKWVYVDELLERQGEQKQEWSETDENRFQNIIACIGDCYNEKDAQDLIRWFKSLRHQPKQVWSKADIKMLELIIDGYQNTEDFSKVDGVFVDWLKSLKDRMEGKEEKK